MILLAFLIGCSVTLSQTKISLVVHDKLLFIFVFSNNNSNNLHIRVRISYCILHITLHYIITFLHILISSSWISSLIFFYLFTSLSHHSFSYCALLLILLWSYFHQKQKGQCWKLLVSKINTGDHLFCKL